MGAPFKMKMKSYGKGKNPIKFFGAIGGAAFGIFGKKRRNRNRTTIMYSVFKTSFKCSQMISRIYRVLLGEEDLPTSERSVFYNNKTYTDKVYNKSIDDMIKDKDR